MYTVLFQFLLYVSVLCVPSPKIKSLWGVEPLSCQSSVRGLVLMSTGGRYFLGGTGLICGTGRFFPLKPWNNLDSIDRHSLVLVRNSGKYSSSILCILIPFVFFETILCSCKIDLNHPCTDGTATCSKDCLKKKLKSHRKSVT